MGAAAVIGILHQSLVQPVQIPPRHEGEKMVLEVIANPNWRDEPTVDQRGNDGAGGVELARQWQRTVFGGGA